jgi:fructose-1,6-bisphosphatase
VKLVEIHISYSGYILVHKKKKNTSGYALFGNTVHLVYPIRTGYSKHKPNLSDPMELISH